MFLFRKLGLGVATDQVKLYALGIQGVPGREGEEGVEENRGKRWQNLIDYIFNAYNYTVINLRKNDIKNPSILFLRHTQPLYHFKSYYEKRFFL